MAIYKTIKEFTGYITKPDKTNAPVKALVTGSQNILIDDQKKLKARKGYSLYGATNGAVNAVESSYDWFNSSGSTINLRSYDDELEFYAGTVDGVIFDAWTRLENSFTAVDFNFAKFWDTSESIDILLFVNGDANIRDWSGAVTSLASATSNTLTKNGTDTWAVKRFLIAGTRKVIINGTAYTYTGGEGTTTLTGVTPDPSAEAADSLVFQQIRTNANQPASGVKNDLIAELNNQIYVGSLTTNEVYVSKNTSFTTYTFSTPRVPGEGALLVLDSPTKAFVKQDQDMFISSGDSDWYKTNFLEFDVGGILTETLAVKKLKTGVLQGAKSQELVGNVGNAIVFLSNEPRLYFLGNIENLVNVQLTSMSDEIKPDFDDEDFSNGTIKFHGNRVYITAPANDKTYILEKREEQGRVTWFWQPPQTIPVRRLAIISNDIYGHSNAVPETYKLFDGEDDNGNTFTVTANMAYRNYGRRFELKTMDELAIEGYISSNTNIMVKVRYEFDGFEQELEKTIDGSNDDILFQAENLGGLGDNPLGDVPLGDVENQESVLPKFKVIFDLQPMDFTEMQIGFETDSTDPQWEILAFGANVTISDNNLIKIKV